VHLLLSKEGGENWRSGSYHGHSRSDLCEKSSKLPVDDPVSVPRAGVVELAFPRCQFDPVFQDLNLLDGLRSTEAPR